MTLIRQIKRAAKDHNLYNGEIDDNWEPSDNIMYSRLCDKFDGQYQPYPMRLNQDPRFLDWLDKYSDPEYADEVKADLAPQKGGTNLKQFVPDKQVIDKEGLSKAEAKARELAVNRNAIQVALNKRAELPSPTPSLPTPEDVVKQEEANEKEAASNQSGSENNSNDIQNVSNRKTGEGESSTSENQNINEPSGRQSTQDSQRSESRTFTPPTRPHRHGNVSSVDKNTGNAPKPTNTIRTR